MITRMDDLGLFPPVQNIRRADPQARIEGEISEVVVDGLPPQGYRIRIEPGFLQLEHGDEAGRRYGHQTLAQLRRSDGSYPEVELEDWPDIEVRGFMLDVSRNRVPNRDNLQWWVDLLVRCRFNHLQLYIEHTFAFVDHPDVWSGASPITGDDLQWLDETCRAAGIELAINQNCLGHMGQWLRHDRYRPRAECPEGVTLAETLTLPPTVLAPTEDNAKFMVELVNEQLAHTTATTVHVGFDEPFELGRGRSREEVEARGLSAVFVEQLRRVTTPLMAEGHSVLFWADVLRHHPEAIGQLPIGSLTPVVWSYDAPGSPPPKLRPEVRAPLEALGFDLELSRSFTELTEPFGDRPVWVAPGTSTWLSLVGRLDNAVANIRDAASTAINRHSPGLLLTDWGDGGHLQPPAVSIPPVVAAGAAAWNLLGSAELDLAMVINDHVVVDPSGLTGAALVEIGGLADQTGLFTRNCSPLYVGLLPHEFTLRWGRAEPDAVREVMARLDGALGDLAAAGPSALDGDRVIEELVVAARLAHHGAQRLLARAERTPLDHVALASELRELIALFRKSWLTTSRPGGLSSSVASLEQTLASYAVDSVS